MIISVGAGLRDPRCRRVDVETQLDIEQLDGVEAARAEVA